MAFTYFFRDLHTLQQITNSLIPYTSGRSHIRVWDAGCASGQEPYSLAIVLAESMGRFAFRNLSIEATDIDGSDRFVDIMARGEYPEEELQRIPDDLREKYFKVGPTAGHLVLDEMIRNRVQFRKHDLLSGQAVGEGYSLILCKNVLLHFQAAERVDVLKMFHKALLPGGFFATEQTQKLPVEVSDLFEQVTDDAQLFRKVESTP